MDFQKSLAPNQEQQTRLQELQSAFEGTGAFKDYRINQLQNQLQQRQFNPRMGMGLGGMRPMGMQPYQGFGRPPMMQQPMQRPMVTPRGGYAQYNQMNQPRQFGAMGYNQPQQQYMNPYQQMRPQPQQFGGYGMGQQMGGYGSYGQMPNPYQPQQMGYNTNNYTIVFVGWVKLPNALFSHFNRRLTITLLVVYTSLLLGLRFVAMFRSCQRFPRHESHE
jgi:hypothetical protein